MTRPCPTCSGSGEVGVKDPRTGTVQRESYGQPVTATCWVCGGSGVRDA